MSLRVLLRTLAAASLAAVWLHVGLAQAELTVVDDSGHRIALPAPAVRIVSLAPHITELLFAAGAGAQVVGVSAHSDHPPQAATLPSVGNSQRIDLERVLALKPDLVVGWKSGNGEAQLARLRQLGLTVFDSEPRRLDAIASTLERLATLTGSTQGHSEARRLRDALHDLRARHAQQRAVHVFYQIWPSPLMTLNDEHIVSEAIRLCGGVNVFGRLRPLAPTVSREAVVRADPELILIADDSMQSDERWQEFTHLRAVRNRHVLRIDGTRLNRATSRMLDATRELCGYIDQARLSR